MRIYWVKDAHLFNEKCAFFGESDLTKFQALQDLFEKLPRLEAHFDFFDVALAYIFRAILPAGQHRQAERTKLAQFDDIPFGQFHRNDQQESFQHGQRVHAGHCGHLCDSLRDSAQV